MLRLVRRLCLAVLVLAGLLLTADRGGAYAASRLATHNAEHQSGGSANVRILGFPFLTQVGRGRLGHVTVSERNIGTSALRIDSLYVTARGVHVSAGQAVAGHVSSVPVDHVDGTAIVTYASLTTGITRSVDLSRGVTLAITPHGTGELTATVTGPLDLHLSVTLPVPEVRSGRLQLGAFAQRFASVLPGGVAGDLTLPLPSLPYGLTLGSATAQGDGLHLAVTGTSVIVR